MANLLEGLNNEQQEAVSHEAGPLLIIAGAGTGKTTVITRKIAYLIAKKLAKPSEILALTFTEKAAEQMEQRVDVLVPYGFVDTWISTFHAFGDRILRDYAIDLGLPANFKVLSATEQAIFLRQNLYSFDLNYFRPVGNPTAHIRELLAHFSRLKDELISPSEYLALARSQSSEIKDLKDKEAVLDAQKTLELARAYERYQDLMIQSGNLDYGDQIYLTHKLLSENPQILKQCQQKFKYILIDEFQDTNYAQYQIVRLLSATHKNLTVVGDDDQSIYRFRGASISNILSFKKDYPDCTQIVLNQNYRSTQQILDASYKLIQHNNPDRLEIKNKINKKLIGLKQGAKPELIHCETLSCECDQVAQKIIDLAKTKKYRFNDFAILARSNNAIEPFIQSLNAKKIPSIFVGASSLFKQPEIKMLIAFFRCLVYPDDNLSFYQLAVSDLYAVDIDNLSKLYSLAKKRNRSIDELLDLPNDLSNFENQLDYIADPKIEEILSDIQKYRAKIKNNRAGEVLYEFLKDKKYFKQLAEQNEVVSEVKIANIAKLFDRIAQFDHTSADQSVHAFLDNLELIIEVGDEVQSSDIDPDLNAVNLMTVHAAKGLEWPVVFIVNTVSERFPSRNMREKIPVPETLIKERLPQGDFHLQEERRLFYVGATRAKDYLFFSSANDYGGKRAKKLSQFVLETLDKIDPAKNKYKLSAIEKIERHRPTELLSNTKIKKTFDGLLKLSRSQIDDYFTCPKKYFFSSVVRIPLPTNWHFTYGTAIHEAIGRYYQKKINGQNPAFDSIVEDFNQSFVSEGFITREHEEQRKRQGIETLAKFYDEDQKINLVPFKIEDSFEFSEDNVKICGRYDLVIKDGETYEIRDFKTSDVRDQKDADRRIRESNQMMIYALAWREKYNCIPKTSLIFIESELKGEKIFSETDLEKTRRMITDVARGIREQVFRAKPQKRQCSLCSYKDICKDSLS